jgi:hypothetical protein
VNLPVNNAPRIIGSNAKTLGFQHQQLLKMRESGGPSDGTRLGHHEKDELLRQQNAIPDGETAYTV